MADSLTDFADQLGAPGAFPTLAEFNARTTTEALKWTDLTHDVVYQIILNMDNRLFSLSRKLMDQAVVHELCVRPTWSKTSKIGRVYNSYQLSYLSNI